MQVNGQDYHTIWLENDQVKIIDQRWLPHDFRIATLSTVSDCATAIKDMWVRGAPLIGITAAYGMYLACLQANNAAWLEELEAARSELYNTRPTAINLQWALKEQWNAIDTDSQEKTKELLKTNADRLKQMEIDRCEQIGEHGLKILRDLAKAKNGKPLNIMTHCNAGWLACIDWGTATAPIYKAHQEGLDIHVWVSETRPRNQGFNITAFELKEAHVPHTLIVDNAAGHLMQRGQVDLLITGADRVVQNGDTANKIGTYMKALAARDNGIPFYVAIPTSSIDFEITDGIREIPIEERDASEVVTMQGSKDDQIRTVQIAPQDSAALNVAFDVTPARYVTGLITENGIIQANSESINQLKAALT